MNKSQCIFAKGQWHQPDGFIKTGGNLMKRFILRELFILFQMSCFIAAHAMVDLL